jgi:hypothetical protein
VTTPRPAKVSLGKACAATICARGREARLAGRGRGAPTIRPAAAKVAMTINLQGVRLDRGSRRAGSNRLLDRTLARRNLVSYAVVEAPAPPPSPGKAIEKRFSARRPLRLRSGKLLDAQNRFLCECLMRDRSGQGLRLTLAKNIGLPTRCHLYDDETGSLHAITTIWRRSGVLGVRFCTAARPPTIKESDRSALRGRYYAVRD